MESTLRSAAYSRYTKRILLAQPELASLIARWSATKLSRKKMADRLDALLSAGQVCPNEAQLKSALRQLRIEVFCTVMERDLAGTADLAEVTGAMSDLAELSIQSALSVLNAELQALYGTPYGVDALPQTLGVVGMGKLGGGELNVSSDVDLIFVYGDEGETTGGARAPISNHEYFSKLGKKLIGALSELTADGYVFRVDMRLRPNGEAGPLVCSLPMLEEYFYVQGREWERYAWVKSRLVSETKSAAAQRLAAQLETLVQPFVYRRYLDFGVIDAVRALHAQIRREAMRRAAQKPDKADDIKLGRGGIREIEFCAQVFQLIRGGQNAGFRVRPTLQALAFAAALGLFAPTVAEQLAQAYGFLRQLEHLLQYADDAQTHVLPVDEVERARLAAALGFANYAEFKQTLDEHRANVERQFDAIFADKNDLHYGLSHSAVSRISSPLAAPATEASPTAGALPAEAITHTMTAAEAAALVWSEMLDDESTPQLLESVAVLGFNASAKILARLTTVWRSVRHTNLPEKSRLRFDLLVERALYAMHELDAKRRDETLLRFLDLLEAINRRGAYLALLIEYPAALVRVLSALGASRWAADYLCSHPQLLDELLDDELLTNTFDWPAFKVSLAAQLAAADGVEQQMDLLRHAHHAELFRILLLDLAGRMTLEYVSDRLSELADAVLDVTLEAVWRQVPRCHCAIPRFAVIAYGKLGGKELAYGSDLDLIFLYDDPDEAAPEIYLSFARRLITWLTSSTGAGQLFDVDLRLRPDGASGLLVTDLNAFRRYQLHEEGAANTAWSWEHQALTRARYCAGDARIGAAFEAIRTQVLTLPRRAATLAQEIVAMRARVLEGHLNLSQLFDLKHDRGGMVDIEFMVQYFVLLYAGSCPELIRNTGNIALLRTAAHYGAITASEAATVGDAYRFYRIWQHRLQLDGIEQHMRVPTAQVQTQREAVLALWARVFK
ncbi:bifunctional [glutamate--ammonia ligase]-adenylyl-L-tyrosine phosphorylase/[glutamate--ammonia-ligase] adenylyltransferase [Mycoavidus sp. B2-EB]|uniref:bifunctional [glutamate--ammonia ligase]-adenylyl-L-tyrosine phosphorylase/[glutamate--ammonia-ligase] adenylyltransferase n=1 Tax=Mycoavidus sp. B2-EB TaxID=2651972 RepID=UPI00162908F1|nr:bifunctional [glutamate--ammonia ligase]-adenylyl-L-tyrosine phosphorylase/[glutamate--ammonia-ligase] adenylyltransferase [Mycoavidus sp. B2-EB]BBO58996.1 glutamate-ammonia-ligase adenylyltransferase [Mycoavidus sp. B2-EB]